MEMEEERDAAQVLARLGDALGEDAGWDGGPMLLMLDQPAGLAPDEVQVGVLRLEGSPAEALAGFVAPTTALAVALVAHGWAWHMDGPPRQDRQRVRVTTAVDRNGSIAGCMRWPDGRVIPDPPTEGRVLDRLRAALRGA